MATERLVERLKERLAEFEREFRVDIPERIRQARELGDLRESGEYETAKDRQGFLNAQIGHLQRRIAELSSIDLFRVPKDRVAFGATVHLEDEETGEEKVYRLVASEEVDAAKGWISTASPVGQALLSKRDGDSVVIRTPGGTRRYIISKLVTLHDVLEHETEGLNG
ncbi:MAG: transcription elongation factor GreA [candidate division NC10 bacterium]|nr:transcription elongation factor GreA [candidate division NC10 bacterium]